MKKWFSKRHVRRKLQAALSGFVSLSLALAPLSADASQTGSQASNSGTNKMASMLSTGVGVLTMATGALSMAKGAQQMTCCMQGCDGAGKESVAKDAANKKTSDSVAKELADKALKNNASDGATGVSGINLPNAQPAKRVDDEFFRRFPDSASLDVNFGATARLGLLVKLFRAPTVTAGGGCIDAALALATGGLMLLQGMMALASARQAAANAALSDSNLGGLGAYDPGSGVGTGTGGIDQSGTSTGGSKIAGDGNKSAIRIDPALLRNGKADQVMSRFEKQFGLDRDQFAKDVASGKDPREILANAPQNPLSVSDMNKATTAARGMSDSEKADALGGSDLAELQKEIMANSSLGAEDTSYQAGKGSGASRKLASVSSDTLDDLGLDGGASSAGSLEGVSPEIKAALAKREEDLAKKSHFDTSLFEVVHRKYAEKARMISGAGIKAGGAAHATGE